MEDLFRRLVGEHEHRERGHRAKTLFKEAVAKEVPTIGRELTAPYAYRNGRLKLIEPERFDAPDSDAVFSRASRWAVEGQFLFETPHPELGDLQLAVVAQFGEESRAVAGSVRKIFDKHSVKLYTFDDLSALFDDVRRSAGRHHAN